MPKPRMKTEIQCRYFRWLIGTRKGVYFGDGRSNTPSLGRHSLGTRDLKEAQEIIHDLDTRMAVEHGKADRRVLPANSNDQQLEFAAGRQLYEKYTQRPRIAGGPRLTTFKRYRAVLDKFLLYAQNNHLRYWNQVNRGVLDGYAGWLDGESYAYATEYLELNTIKQILKFLVENNHLPQTALFSYPLQKPQGTDTYCWRQEEVQAIIEHCHTTGLYWLENAVTALSTTGLRIGELASLRWTDLDLDKGTVTLTDESTSAKRGKSDRRTTKTGASRSFPIHAKLRSVFVSLERSADGLIFHGPRGGKIKADTMRRILIRDVLEPLKDRFPPQGDEPSFVDGRLHSFRHYFCSACANNNVPERVLMSWLGHSSSKMIRRYYHLHSEESQRHIEQIEFI